MDAEKSSMYFNLFVIPSKVRKNNQTDVPVCCVCVNRFANCTYVSRCLTWSCRVHHGNSYWMVYIYIYIAQDTRTDRTIGNGGYVFIPAERSKEVSLSLELLFFFFSERNISCVYYCVC